MVLSALKGKGKALNKYAESTCQYLKSLELTEFMDMLPDAVDVAAISFGLFCSPSVQARYVVPAAALVTEASRKAMKAIKLSEAVSKICKPPAADRIIVGNVEEAAMKIHAWYEAGQPNSLFQPVYYLDGKRRKAISDYFKSLGMEELFLDPKAVVDLSTYDMLDEHDE